MALSEHKARNLHRLKHPTQVFRRNPFRRCTKDYMTRMDGDLSGKKDLGVYLWLRKGQGYGVVTDVRIQRAPTDHANPMVAKVLCTLLAPSAT